MHFSVALVILILKKDSTSFNDKITSYQRVAKREDFEDILHRELVPEVKKEHVQKLKMEKEINKGDDTTKRELQEAKARIDQLEKKIAFLEGRIPQKYPEVTYLGYKERKRILVSV